MGTNDINAIKNILEDTEDKEEIVNLLDYYVLSVRFKALGWAYTEACSLMNEEKDIRAESVYEFIFRGEEELE